MSVELGAGSDWQGSRIFRDEQERSRRRRRAVGLGLWVFGALMLQVWVSTEVVREQARISQMEQRLTRMAVDLTAAEDRFSMETTYGELLPVAARVGLTPDGVRQRIALPKSTSPVDELRKQPLLAGFFPASKLPTARSGSHGRRP